MLFAWKLRGAVIPADVLFMPVDTDIEAQGTTLDADAVATEFNVQYCAPDGPPSP